jgi:hypothetical protein
MLKIRIYKDKPSRRSRVLLHSFPSHLVKLSYSLIFEMDKTSCYAMVAALEKIREKRKEARKTENEIRES